MVIGIRGSTVPKANKCRSNVLGIFRQSTIAKEFARDPDWLF